jgi:hypothetical protein
LRTIDRQSSCEKVPKLGLFVKIQLTRVAPGAAPQGNGAAGPAFRVFSVRKSGPVLSLDRGLSSRAMPGRIESAALNQLNSGNLQWGGNSMGGNCRVDIA